MQTLLHCMRPNTACHWPAAYAADGVDGVTQQPIPPGGTFRYKFKVSH